MFITCRVQISYVAGEKELQEILSSFLCPSSYKAAQVSLPLKTEPSFT